MTIISFKICPCYQRISILLEFINIPYKTEFLSLDHPPEWFTKLSSNLEPILRIENRDYIIGFHEVMDYLNKEYQISENLVEVKSEHKNLLELANLQYMIQCSTQRSQNLEEFNRNSFYFYKLLSEMEAVYINGNTFFYGNQLSMLDIAWIPILFRTQLIKQYTGFDFLNDYSNLHVWKNNLLKNLIPKNSVSSDFEEVFKAYYLNDQTYLGKLIPLDRL
jgi:glutathione S-transferase